MGKADKEKKIVKVLLCLTGYFLWTLRNILPIKFIPQICQKERSNRILLFGPPSCFMPFFI